MLRVPAFASVEAYAARLGDVAHWRPYAEAALARSSLADRIMTSGFEGTYPTLVGEHLVVKLLGYFPGWRQSFATEPAANRTVATITGLSAPRVVSSGALFPGRDADWLLLITERLDGRAWRESDLDAETAGSIAADLGRQVRRLHDAGAARVGRVDWLAEARWKAAEARWKAAERHRARKSLPQHLIDQLPAYLGSYRTGHRCLVHGDLTEDHLFVIGNELQGLIDWGDAIITDPFYELGALHLGAFAGDRRSAWLLTPGRSRRRSTG